MNSIAFEGIANSLRAFALELMSSSPLPGGTVALINKDGIQASFAFGLSNIDSQTKTELKHKFEIGSISKTYTALAIYALQEDGKLHVEDEVTKYLPWFVAGIPDGPVTISQCLSHTAGFILGSDHLPDERAQVWEMRNRRRAGIGQWHYSNLGYMVLGQVIMAITGLTIGEYLHERILSRMNASDVRVPVIHSDLETMATGYWPQADDRPWLPGEKLAPATWFELACADGNIAANIDELSQLVVLLLNRGYVNGQQVLRSEFIDSMCTPCASTGEPVVKWGSSPQVSESRYGHGLNVEQIDGHHLVTHGGGMVGYSSFMLSDLTAGYGIVVLTNSTGEHPAAQLIARVGHQLMNDSTYLLPTTHARLTSGELAESLLGRFYSAELEFVITDNAEFITLASAGVAASIYRTWNDRFTTDHPLFKGMHLYSHENSWSWGSHYFTSEPHEEPELSSAQSELIGHYRCFSPWYTNFRIVAHSGSMYLVAPGGVEAQTDECELIEVETGIYRIGADSNTPEHLSVGPVVDGKAVWINRDGAIYSRTFTD